MRAEDQSEYESLRIIYNEIIQGFSYSEKLNLYIKHLTESENIQIVKRRRIVLERVKSEGLPCEADKLKELDKEGIWTAADEKEIAEYKIIIADNERHMNTALPEFKASLQAMIDKYKSELQQVVQKRTKAIGKIAEHVAEQDSFDFLMYLVFYKDASLKEKVFSSSDDISEMDEEIIPYSIELDTVFGKLRDEKLRKISVLPFFLNPFSFTKENVADFLGKPIYYLTSFQLSLFSLGSRNLSIQANADDVLPDMSSPDIGLQELADWHDKQHSILLGKQQHGKSGITKTEKVVQK